MTAQAPPADRVAGAIVDLVRDASASTVGPQAIERARTSLIDTVGVALAGSATPYAVILRNGLDATGAPAAGGVRVLGTADRRPLLDAVFVNAYAAHALDFDDTIQGVTTHPSCHLVPALLGLVEAAAPATTIEEVLLAHLIGIEVEGRLAKAINPAHSKRGWHTTGTLGVVATAASSARLLGLDATAVGHAVAIACSTAAGLRANFGSPVKPLHAARAARSGVEAALLARAGFFAARDPFEHRFGYFAAYLSDAGQADLGVFDRAAMLACPTISEVTLKPYPCCGEATSLVQAAGLIHDALDGERITAIRLGLTPFAREILEFDAPQTSDEARFSGPYCVAAALSGGTIGIADFDEAAIRRDPIRGLMALTTVGVDPAVSGHGGAVEVVTESGRTLREHIQTPVGHASVGMPAAVAYQKFKDCSSAVLDQDSVDALYRGISDAGRSTPVLTALSALTGP